MLHSNPTLTQGIARISFNLLQPIPHRAKGSEYPIEKAIYEILEKYYFSLVLIDLNPKPKELLEYAKDLYWDDPLEHRLCAIYSIFLNKQQVSSIHIEIPLFNFNYWDGKKLKDRITTDINSAIAEITILFNSIPTTTKLDIINKE